MRETPSGIFCDHLRETSTSAHLISCCLTYGRALSIPGLFQNRQKARKLGLLRPLPLQIIMKKTYYFTPVLCKSSCKTDFLPRSKKYRIFHGGGVKRLT